MDLIPADTTYHVRRDQNDDYDIYDVVGSNVKKDIARVLRDAMNPWAHVSVFCSARFYGFGFVISPLLWKRRSVNQYPVGFWSIRFGKEKIESVELRPIFRIEDSTLHYLRATEIYQKTTAAKYPTHIFVVKKATKFWRTAESRGEVPGHKDYGASKNCYR